MSRSKSLLITLMVVGVLAGGIVACKRGGDHAEPSPEAPASRDWPVVGGDWSNTRFSVLEKINTSNVSKLGAAWVRELDGGEPIGEPIVANGRMYITSAQATYALDARTGKPVWTYKVPVPVQGFYKGVGFGGGMVFVGLSNSRIVALDAETGEERWIGVIGDEDFDRQGQWISAGPDYVDDLVICGLANGDFGILGRIVALDAKTGKQVWRFNTVAFTGEAAKTWPPDSNWRQGGVGVWMNAAIDRELGLVYYGTGNPMPQWGGELREGDNLYSDSIIALDIKSGELRWHFQVTHHDIWEADLGMPLVLYDAVIDGQSRPAVATISTYGYLFQLDRATGKPLWPIEERPVPQNTRLKTSPTQPFPVGGDSIGPDCVPPDMIPEGFKPLCAFDPIDFDLPNAMYPIVVTRNAPAAYDPRTQTFYATGAIFPFWLRRYEDPNIFVPDTSAPGTKQKGLLAALHAPTNRLVYEHQVPYRTQQHGAGFIATAGGLLFHGETDGLFNAYEAKTGEKVWSFQTGANVNKPAATYEAGGEQYVAVASGTGVWSFKLGGKLPQRSAPPVPPEETTFGGRIVPTDKVIVGPVIGDAGLEVVRKAFDEYAFEPRRARVSVGAELTWVNEGKLPKTIAAKDGSWSTGLIAPGKSVTLKFDKPGTYTYIAKEYPFMLGELTVEQ